jgi:UDP-N-acetylglucosamine 2-epimerase (non-hydrolysing)
MGVHQAFGAEPVRRRGALGVLLAFGTRPEAIKMLPVLAELRRRPSLSPLALSTGQHGAMLAQAVAAFGERIDIAQPTLPRGLSLSAIFARVLTGVTKALERHAPDLVLVHGDTTTALAAALAAFHLRIPVGHVEAGQRSYDLDRPWPEELNRVAVDAMAELLFAPTERAAANLLGEYRARGRILVTGNSGIDALLAMEARLVRDAALAARVAAALPAFDPAKRLVLVTAHRRESQGAGLARICDAVAALAARGDVEIAWPLHNNPAVREPVLRALGWRPSVHLLEPLDPAAMVFLLRRAALVLTDSGGLQEEAPALGKPLLVLREVTERPEAVEAGAARLVGTDAAAIVAQAERLLDDPLAYAAMARPVFPFGDGSASCRIADAIEDWARTRNAPPALMVAE